MAELKSCPFCGYGVIGVENASNGVRISCFRCPAQIVVLETAGNEAANRARLHKAVEAWNRRTKE